MAGDDTALFKNKYRIPSTRLKGWDYSSVGWYFITICIKGKVGLLGDVINNEVRLSCYGKIVREEWENSFEIRRELICKTYIIMPDHIHGLVGIVKITANENVNVNKNATVNANVNVNVETHGRASLPTPMTPTPNSKMPQRTPKSISSFVAGFKSVATKRINEMRNTPGQPLWQPRFHDRIIRDEIAFFAVQQYIDKNPMRWWTKQRKNI